MTTNAPDILNSDYSSLPISAREALAQNKKFYFSGKECIQGHLVPRYVKGGCVACVRSRAKIADKKLKAKIKKQNAKKRSMTIKVCARQQCQNEFSPTNRLDQIYCSTRCSDRAGKQFYKERNKNSIKEAENKRRKRKYENDEQYRLKQLKRSNQKYHSLSKSEKKERQEKQKNSRDPQAHKTYMREYAARKNKEDIDYRLAGTLRARIRAAIKSNSGRKAGKTTELIGCSIQELKQHLEKQFDERMSWDNYGDWHIDHIRPIASFKNLGTDEAIQKVCFNYQNLQPLWASENMSWGAKEKPKNFPNKI